MLNIAYNTIFLLLQTLISYSLSQTSSIVEKRQDIEEELISELSILCNSCPVDASLIQEGTFRVCTDMTSVTFRAMIHGTSQYTSLELVDLIQQWVLQQQSIVILSVETIPSTHCVVEIDSFDAEGCMSPSQGLPLPTIIGAALGGGVLLIFSCVTVLIVVCVMKKKCNHKGSHQTSLGFRGRSKKQK